VFRAARQDGGMSDGVRVRPAVVEDDAALLAVELEAWSPASGFPSLTDPEATAFFNERTTPEKHLVAEYRGEVVGYVRLVAKTPLLENTHVLGIFGLAVSPRVRRVGIASALLDAAEVEARAWGARKLSLRVLGGNAPAQRLYERHGYVIEGRYVAEFLIDGHFVDDLTMAKLLTPPPTP
jgi:ribosomal protein S18 acetylase RimI-like enzyme